MFASLVLHWQLTLHMNFWQLYAHGLLATVRSIMLCISRLYRKQMCLYFPIWVWFPSIYTYLQVTKKLSNSVGSKKSKHNTDHAAHKTDYSDLCSKLHRQCQISGHREQLHLHAVRFLDLQRPGMPECLSVWSTERLSIRTVSNGGRRQFSLLTELSNSDVFVCAHVCSSCITSLGQELHHQISRVLVVQWFDYMLS